MSATVGLADLVRLFRALPREHRADYAALLGFQPGDVRTEQPTLSGSRNGTRLGSGESPPSASPDSVVGMRFWRVDAAIESVVSTEPEPEPEPQSAQGLTLDDLQSVGHSLDAPFPADPLASWATLWSGLRASLQRAILGRDPNIAALVRTWARGEHVHRFPREERPAWPASASIWIDRSARLVPFWHDQDAVLQLLKQHCGHAAISARYVCANPQQLTSGPHGDLAGRAPSDAAVPVLVLGDLGFYGSDIDRGYWLRTAERLGRYGVRLAALVPCPSHRWDRDVARAWNAIAWEFTRGGHGGAAPDKRAAALLQLIAPTALAQPGLVRALRRLLPAAEADASTEADVWQHSDVRVADATGLVLKAEASARWRSQFAVSVSTDLQAQVRALIERWHSPLPRELLHAETLAWLGWTWTAAPGNTEQALAFSQRLQATAYGASGTVEDVEAAKDYARHLLGGVADSLYDRFPWLKKLWGVALRDVPDVQRPPSIRLEDLRDSTRSRAKQWWAVHQQGNALSFAPVASGMWPSGRGAGSPIAMIPASDPVVWVGRGRDVHGARLDPATRIALLGEETVTLETEHTKITLGVWQRASWAVAAGRDRYGLWAAFEVHGVPHRMRWIPPGRFKRGSPPGERGRDYEEIVQHTVTLTEGWWMGETQVTQALWHAVVGKNPSRFRSADRPVEQVSWNDCREFIAKLNQSLRGLVARMPTEAEWECACRAGTQGAAWVGDITIQGDNNAPELDAIAWYGGNSGMGFDLQGENSSGWPGKQHTHTRAGTHPVAGREANPFGLYDMLGNVYEWCGDPHRAGRDRYPSMRGGSWRSFGKAVRAAARRQRPRDDRDSIVGVRLAGNDVFAVAGHAKKTRSGNTKGRAGGESQTSVRELATPQRKHRKSVR